MISEETIDQCIERIAAEEIDWVKNMAEDQPVLAAFLASEDMEAFMAEETKYLYYLVVLCWMCFDETYPILEELDEDALSLKEEQNWNRIDSLRPASLKNIVDRWMPDFEEPELLYYIEDALILDAEDPDQVVTKAGQIPMFVTLLTIIEAFIAAVRNENNLKETTL